MDLEYSSQYSTLYRNHWWWRARERLVISTIEEIKRHANTATILDIGCGDALMFDQLARFGEVEGVEFDKSAISGDGRWRDRIYVSSFDGAFQPGKHYSLILMLDVLEHLRDAAISLNRAKELLNPEGTLILTVPAFSCLWTSHDDLNCHFKRYTRKDLIEMASKVGLKILKCKYFFHWMFAPKLLLHFKESYFGTHSHVPRVPSPWVNEILLKFSIAEQKLFRNVPIPIGSSIIAIARHQ